MASDNYSFYDRTYRNSYTIYERLKFFTGTAVVGVAVYSCYITATRFYQLGMAVFKVVKTLFKNHPLLANSVTFGTMWGFSDFSQQFITKRILDPNQPPEPINKGTIVRCTIVGSCVTSNILFFWYKWMEKRFIGSSYKMLVKKMILDQFVLTPPLLSAFFISMSILECKEDITAEWKEKLVPTLQKAWLFWFPAQMINFLFIPSVMRITYISCCSFIWTNILCFIKRANLANNKSTTEQIQEPLTL